MHINNYSVTEEYHKYQKWSISTKERWEGVTNSVWYIVLSALYINSLNVPTISLRYILFYPHFTDEAIEAQRSWESGHRFSSSWYSSPGMKLR